MSNSVLMNFYIPKNLKNRLEDVCESRHLSRTSFILTTLEPEIERWEGKLTRQGTRVEPDLPKFFSSYEDEETSSDW